MSLFAFRGASAAEPVAPSDRRPRLDGVPVDRLPEGTATLPEAKGGRRRRITVVGEDVLANPCRPIPDPTSADTPALGSPELRQLIADMFVTMDVAAGVGLAANQIGENVRVFVYDCPDLHDIRHVGHVINPVLSIPPGSPRELSEEGCLSVPGPHADLSRATRAIVTGTDQRGNPVRLEGDGLFARCLQHECDHLDGTLYVDRLGGRERRRVLREMPALAEETWAEWDERAGELGV